MAYIRQSGLDSGLGFQGQVAMNFSVAPSLLGSSTSFIVGEEADAGEVSGRDRELLHDCLLHVPHHLPYHNSNQIESSWI